MSTMKPTLCREITVYCSKEVNIHPLFSAEHNRRPRAGAWLGNAALKNAPAPHRENTLVGVTVFCLSRMRSWPSQGKSFKWGFIFWPPNTSPWNSSTIILYGCKMLPASFCYTAHRLYTSNRNYTNTINCNSVITSLRLRRTNQALTQIINQIMIVVDSSFTLPSIFLSSPWFPFGKLPFFTLGYLSRLSKSPEPWGRHIILTGVRRLVGIWFMSTVT